jgi:hypothetical protein
MLICLELFSGTGSVGRVFRRAGWHVISVDIEAKFKPDIVADVLSIELDRWPSGYFTFVHASPPCQSYSNAFTRGERNTEGADMLSLHTVNLIKALKPRFYLIENPASGLLKDRLWMRNLPSTIASYCHYSDWGYRKDTMLWSNLWDETFWRPKRCKKDCMNMLGVRHRCSAQRGYLRPKERYPEDHNWSLEQLYRIPGPLIEAILEQVEQIILREAHDVEMAES